MGWLLTFTLLNVGLSAGIMFFLARRRELSIVPALAMDGAEAVELPTSHDLQQLREFSQFFQQMLHSVDCKVADHSQRMHEINREIETKTSSDTDQQLLLSAIAQILSVNNKLTSDLNSARGELQSQRKQLDLLVSEVRTDSLTSLANRRSLDEDLNRRLDQWRRNHTPLSLLLLDVDRFKQLNDQFGHPAGDRVLQEVARILDADLREMDLTARYGGEEFAVLLPDTKLADAGQVAERLRMAIAAASFEHQGRTLKATVSVGVTSAVNDDSQQSILQRADSALYAAKHAGRNCTYSHDGDKLAAMVYNAAVARHTFRKKVAIAQYRSGTLPDGADFEHYECRDLSAGGLSFVASQPPQASMLVVEMEDKTGIHYVLARVVSMRNEGTDEAPLYRIGCSFQGRLAEAHEINAAQQRQATAATPSPPTEAKRS